MGDHGFVALKPNSTINLSNYVNMNYINLTKSVVHIVSSIYPKEGYVNNFTNIFKCISIKKILVFLTEKGGLRLWAIEKNSECESLS